MLSGIYLEYSEKSKRLIISFLEASPAANTYRGELMGLMAIHLILLAANKVWSNLRGDTTVYLDWTALERLDA